VLLTLSFAYKLKKPKNFDFFDYSTPDLRRHFCGQEVLLNTRLAPQVYLGVAPVLAFTQIRSALVLLSCRNPSQSPEV